MNFRFPGSQMIGDILIGDECSIWYNAVIRADTEMITIGSRVNIQDNCVLHSDPDYPLFIGNDVTVGHGAILHGCTIEKACIIGMGAIVMNGAFISPHSIVAAGAVVTEEKRFPEGSLIMGVPAKAVRTLSEAEIQKIYESAQHYVQNAEKQLISI